MTESDSWCEIPVQAIKDSTALASGLQSKKLNKSLIRQRNACSIPTATLSGHKSQTKSLRMSARAFRVPRRAALTSQLSNSVPREFATSVNVWSTPSGCVTKSRWAKPPQFHIINKVIIIGRLGQNAEAKTAQNNKEYVVLNIATQESWKNDKGEYETRTEWHRVYAWRNLSKFAKTLQKGQLITLEGTLRYREVEDEFEGSTFKHRIAEIHAISMKRLSKIEAADDPADGAGDE